MGEFKDLIERYLAAWNEQVPSERRRLVEEVFAADAKYVDPLGVVEGRDAIDAMIGAVQARFPGFVFSLAGPVDAHHDQGRFTWELAPVGVEAPIVGFDVAVVDGDGRVRDVFGFLDKVPSA